MLSFHNLFVGHQARGADHVPAAPRLLGLQGFITATSGGALRICQLPARVRLDSPWPLQKVPLRATPHCLAFYAEARLYVLLTSRQARPFSPPSGVNLLSCVSLVVFDPLRSCPVLIT